MEGEEFNPGDNQSQHEELQKIIGKLFKDKILSGLRIKDDDGEEIDY
jgi:hypothetical protein